jgi:hypothetical protein
MKYELSFEFKVCKLIQTMPNKLNTTRQQLTKNARVPTHVHSSTEAATAIINQLVI